MSISVGVQMGRVTRQKVLKNGTLSERRDRLELGIERLQRRHRGEMAGGVEVDDGAGDQQRHRLVQTVQRVVGALKKKM